MESKIEIYRSQDGEASIDVVFEEDTVWLTNSQLVTLFGSSKANISEHVKHIFLSDELDEAGTVRNFRTVQQEGARLVVRDRIHYNLDVIIAVGYRVNTKQGTQFRQWATRRLRDFLVKGYAINEARLEQKQEHIQTLQEGIRILSRAIEEKVSLEGLNWLAAFAKGLALLDDYDHEQLDKKGRTVRPAIYPDLAEYHAVVEVMKADFESAVFGKEKDESFQSAVAQIGKGFADEDFYPSVEEKAATLLYLIIKNHSFVDGNKRIAAACFLLFLNRNNLLISDSGDPIISNEALASLTLFAAASKPDEMDTVKNLMISILNRNQ
jgi:death-on-curing family protein